MHEVEQERQVLQDISETLKEIWKELAEMRTEMSEYTGIDRRVDRDRR